MGEQGTTTAEAVDLGVWKDVALLLLGATADHAVHCGEGEVESFRRLVRESIEGLRTATEAEQILTNAGGIAQAVVHYSKQTQLRVNALLSNQHDHVESAPVAVPRSSTVDLCTGLPQRSEAEVALQLAIGRTPDKGRKLYAAVFYLHRMALTHARFGEAIGNQVLLLGSQHIATKVTGPNDLLFRWSGPAFVGILERHEPLLSVNGELQRLISAAFSRFFETPARSVYLPVKITADVVPLFDTNYTEVADRLENFIQKSSDQAVAD